MKILFLAHRFPCPPSKGDKIRTFNIIKYLAKEHDIYLVSLCDQKTDMAHSNDLKDSCREVYIFNLTSFTAKIRGLFYLLINKSASLGYFYSHRVKKKVDALMRSNKFDVVIVRSSSWAQYVIDKDISKVIDIGDCDSAKWKQYAAFTHLPMSWVYNKEYKLLQKYEQLIAKKFDYVTVVSEFEKKCFSEFTKVDNFFVVPNGADHDGEIAACYKPIKNRIIFTGTMNYFVNIDGVVYFCNRILPLIKKNVPEVEFYIVGRDPTPAVTALTKIKGVFITGSVKDIKVYLHSAAVFIAPLRMSQGIQNKILEAMSIGLPVVATSKAVAGFNPENGKDLFIADGDADFADKVTMLLRDADERKRIGKNAVSFIQEHHDWEKNLSGFSEILSLIQSSGTKQ